jgi:flagellar motor switch protein FliN/FliY
MSQESPNGELDSMPGASSLDDEWASALAQQQDTTANPDNDKSAGRAVDNEYQPAEFQNLQQDTEVIATDNNKLDMILDISVTIALQIGRSKISIRNLMQLNQGSVVELDRLAGEPLDVLVNGTLIAHGEVVMVNEKYGIRLTDIISPAERVRNLNESEQ